MQYTHNITVFKRAVSEHVPGYQTSSHPVYIYVQDLSESIDYYFIQYNPESDTVLAIVDPLMDRRVLYFDEIPLSLFTEHDLFFRIYRRKGRPSQAEIWERVAALKYFN